MVCTWRKLRGMTKRTMIQVDVSQGALQRTVWVDAMPTLAIGVHIGLKGIEGHWQIDKLYDKLLDIEQINSQRNFDNNNYDVHKGLFS